MPYLTPKTDWAVRLNDGVYIGDFLNVTDYSRITGNITYCKQLAEALYNITIQLTTMPEHEVGDVPLASDFNAIESNIQTLCSAITTPSSWTEQKTYYANKPVPNTGDWNRWEKTIVGLKARIDQDAQWINFITSDEEEFLTSDGLTFRVLEA